MTGFLKNGQLNRDIAESARMWRVVGLIALTDMVARYRRTLLGPLWIVIGLAFGSLGLGLLWSELWGMPKSEIVPSITVGFLVWIFISTCILEGSACLLNDITTIQNMRTPISFYSLLCLAKQLINFAHSLLIILCVSVVFPPDDLLMVLWAIPALLIITVFLFLASTLLAILCARFRDIQPLLAAVMPMLFFLSPVLFRVQQAEDISWLIWLNPFTYFIVLIVSLAGERTTTVCCRFRICIVLACYVALFVLMQKKRSQIVYWL